ncbi:hypothetical protein WME79_06925 [Sorangium sp. So ce726]|uniref:hypothetical protein n=1 Tax=Sorangium sp. So ce726 TaxID=3133319 RepID=UPI003F639004
MLLERSPEPIIGERIVNLVGSSQIQSKLAATTHRLATTTFRLAATARRLAATTFRLATTTARRLAATTTTRRLAATTTTRRLAATTFRLAATTFRLAATTRRLATTTLQVATIASRQVTRATTTLQATTGAATGEFHGDHLIAAHAVSLLRALYRQDPVGATFLDQVELLHRLLAVQARPEFLGPLEAADVVRGEPVAARRCDEERSCG